MYILSRNFWIRFDQLIFIIIQEILYTVNGQGEELINTRGISQRELKKTQFDASNYENSNGETILTHVFKTRPNMLNNRTEIGNKIIGNQTVHSNHTNVAVNGGSKGKTGNKSVPFKCFIDNI